MLINNSLCAFVLLRQAQHIAQWLFFQAFRSGLKTLKCKTVDANFWECLFSAKIKRQNIWHFKHKRIVRITKSKHPFTVAEV
jgi:hypothetical protein